MGGRNKSGHDEEGEPGTHGQGEESRVRRGLFRMEPPPIPPLSPAPLRVVAARYVEMAEAPARPSWNGFCDRPYENGHIGIVECCG